MKPFNLEEAKAGKRVITGSGNVVRILCFDFKHPNGYSIAGITTDEFGVEQLDSWTASGHYYVNEDVSELDLFMASTKREGWLNIYPNNTSYHIFESKEAADRGAGMKRVDCIHIEWNE